ncbi:acylphosphatase [Candidatus Woesearchaeota archaeon]|nr:acylphosphatase [Candidatus Woesearchaeota archaeon]
MTSLKRIHIFIHGNVQKVGFRAEARFVAKNLHLKGWARNNPNGTVEITAEGVEDALKEFYRWCQRGPRNARVDKLDLEWKEATKEFKQFTIA